MSYWSNKTWKTTFGYESAAFLRQALTANDGQVNEEDLEILLSQMYEVASAHPTVALRINELCRYVAAGKVLRLQWRGAVVEIKSLDALREFVLSVNGSIDIREVMAGT